METALLVKEAGGSVDSYTFRVGTGLVEVIHEEDGEFRSEQYLERAPASGLWMNLKSLGFQDGGTTPSFVPDEPEALVAASDPTARGAVYGLVAMPAAWALVMGIYKLITILV